MFDRRVFMKLGLVGGLTSLALGRSGRARAEDSWPDSPFLKGNFRPVTDELTVDRLPVEGVIPDGLHGMYVRNGPNPAHPPIKGYHWFDGDGMLHGTTFRDGIVSYANRWVRTEAFELEQKAHMTLWPSLMEPPFMSRAPKGAPAFKNAANTALLWYNNQLLTLWEGGNPYQIRVPSLETVRAYDFDGGLKHPLTAHPKRDPITGELLTFGYSVTKKPYLHYSVFDATGTLKHTLPLTLPKPVMMHDFAITERFTLFMDLPEVFTLRRAFMGKNPFHFEPTTRARLGLLPRFGTEQDLKWFDISPCFVFHVLGAWEEGDEVNLVACRYERFPEIINGEQRVADRNQRHPEKAYLHRWRLNLVTGAVKEDFLDDVPSEFPRIHEGRTGRKTRFGYAIAEEGLGLIKYDLQSGGIVRLNQPAHKLSEPIFVPDPKGSAEDDGWILCYAYEMASDKSECWVMDARQLDAGPVARVILPRRVPFGFHATWVPGEGLET